MIAFSCRTCNAVLDRPDSEADTTMICPSCGQRLLVPQAAADGASVEQQASDRPREPSYTHSPAPSSQEIAEKIRFNCPHCQAAIRAPIRKAGVTTTCPHCHGRIQVPMPATTSASFDKITLAPLEPPPESKQPTANCPMIRMVCPSCKRSLKAPTGAVGKKGRCKHCGTRLVVRGEEQEIIEALAKPLSKAVELPVQSIEGSVPSGTSPTPDDEESSEPRLEPSPSLLRREFLDFLIEHRNPEPTFRFTAFAGISEDVPRFAMQFPSGEVEAYEGFLVFLTTTMTRPGLQLAVNTFAKVVQEKMLEKSNPIGALGQKLLGAFQTEDRFQQALLSPNSIFIPFRLIRGVNDIPSTFLRAHRIQVLLPRKGMIICQDRALEGGGTHSWYTGKWQEDFVQLLKGVADENARTQRDV